MNFRKFCAIHTFISILFNPQSILRRLPRWDFVHKCMAVFDAVDIAIVAGCQTLLLVSSHSSETIGMAVDKVAVVVAPDFEQLLWHCICEFKENSTHRKSNEILLKRNTRHAYSSCIFWSGKSMIPLAAHYLPL